VIRQLRKFIDLDGRQKLILVQAWCLLCWYRAAILLGSFKRLVSKLKHQPPAMPLPSLQSVQQDESVMIGHLVAAAARYTPWQSPCLVQVLVTQRLLAKRKIPGQFYLGVRRGHEGSDDPTAISAHAWLQCGDEIVNGAAGHEQYTAVSAFSWGVVQD
jgi:hypothetical protein